MNTSISSSTNGGTPHIAASSSSEATSSGVILNVAGDLGEGDLAPLHQPRQHHQQAGSAGVSARSLRRCLLGSAHLRLLRRRLGRCGAAVDEASRTFFGDSTSA